MVWLAVLLLALLAYVFRYEIKDVQIDNTSQTTTYEIDDKSFLLADSLLPTSNGEIVKHKYYTLSYLEKFEQAEWVAYTLTSNQLTNDNRERPYFEVDRKVSTASADWKNFKNSGYDKGHLCPAGDRRFSEEAYNETFLTSNAAPQEHNFNAGIWNRLEQYTRRMAKKHKEIYVITGSSFARSKKTIGYEHVSVPSYFYKIIVYKENDELQSKSFLIPHYNYTQIYNDYITSIDRIEQFTQIDFFPLLDEAIEAKLESEINNK